MSSKDYFNPFPGLRSFEENEEYLFFGRETQIDELLTRLGKTRFLAVVGASGSGKSSLVKSGLLPSLHSGYLSEAGSGWRICTLRPGSDPIGNLARALCSEEIIGSVGYSRATPQLIESILRRGDDGIGEVLRQLSDISGQNHLVMVDQFEELFRFSGFEKAEQKDARDSVMFINLLLGAARFRNLKLYVVFTMRSDFLGDCTEFRGLPEAINDGQYLIPRMTREERKAAITGPVAVGGAQMSQALVTRLLNDVGDNPDQLPILQHALMRTWDYWAMHATPDEPIDLQHYEAIGTMSRALSLHAEEAYAEIQDAGTKEMCRKLFRALTEKHGDGRGTRRPIQISEACEIAHASVPQLMEVIELFRKQGRSFLMPPPGVKLTEDTVVDISHESLMRIWKRLMQWVQEEVESAELYQRLAQSAELYQAGKTGLWRDPELQMALNWLNTQKPNLSWARRYNSSFHRAINFLQYSESEKQREIKGIERKRKAAVLRLRIFTGIILVAFCMALYFGFVSYKSEKEARASEKLAKTREHEKDSLGKIALAKQELAETEANAARIAKKQATESAKSDSVQKLLALDALNQARLSLNIAKKATQRANDSASVARTQRIEAQVHAEIARQEAERARIAKTEVDRLRLLAEAKSMALKSNQLLNTPGKDTLSMQLAALAYAINKKLRGAVEQRLIYDAFKSQLNKYLVSKFHERGDFIFEPAAHDIRVVEFTDPDRFITAGGRGNMVSWQISDSLLQLKTIATSDHYEGSFTSLCFIQSLDAVIAGTNNGDLIVWQPHSGSRYLKPVYKGLGKCLFISPLKMSANELILVAVFSQASVMLRLSPPTFRVISETRIKGLPDSVSAATLCNGAGDTLLLLANGKEILSLKMNEQGALSPPLKILDFPEPVAALAFGPKQNLLAVGGERGSLNVYRINNGSRQLITHVRGFISSVSALRFSADDSLLYSCSNDHSIRLSRIFYPQEEGLLLNEKEAWIRQLALSSHHRYLVVTGQSSLVQVWPATLSAMKSEAMKIKQLDNYVQSRINEILLKNELGNELYDRILELYNEKLSLDEVWKKLKTEELK